MSTLNITTEIVGNEYLITAVIATTGDIPTDIFMYENTGTGLLGEYQGVCTKGEYLRFSPYSGVYVPVFGNKYLKYTSAIMRVPLSMDPTIISSKIIADVKTFKATYLASQSNTQVIPI